MVKSCEGVSMTVFSKREGESQAESSLRFLYSLRFAPELPR
jgi:hypothetical protein